MAGRKVYKLPREMRLILAEFIASRCRLSTKEQDLSAICQDSAENLEAYTNRTLGSGRQRNRVLYAIQLLTEVKDVKTKDQNKSRRKD